MLGYLGLLLPAGLIGTTMAWLMSAFEMSPIFCYLGAALTGGIVCLTYLSTLAMEWVDDHGMDG